MATSARPAAVSQPVAFAPSAAAARLTTFARSVAAARRAALALTTAIALWPVNPVHAEPVFSANVHAELLSEQETVRPAEPFTVGIALRPSPDWHTYWENPGDSGLPTRVEWTLPPGFRAGPLQWPHPIRLGVPPYVTYGYESDALLLARIEAPATLRAGSEVNLKASVRWLACREDACVPGKAELPLRIRVENSVPLRDARWTAAFDAARADLPRSLDGWSASASDLDGKLQLRVTGPRSKPSTTGIQVFPLVQGIVEASAEATVRPTDDGFVFEAPRATTATPLPDSFGVVLVADGGWDASGGVKALRIDAARDLRAPGNAANGSASEATAGAPRGVDAGARPQPAPTSGGATNAVASVAIPAARDRDTPTTLWAAIVLAFAGGLVLNLMPCVFPVLSLKVLGFVHVAHHQAARARRHGYAFTAGVLVSFWVLAAVLLALRAAGGALGWGFQLQSPLFVAGLAALLLAMALNLFGVFEVGTSVTGAVGRFDSQAGYRGSFLSGVLATLLATPCSAPFMGTAVGYALVQPPAVSFAVFTSLGAGMAAPYLVLACAPALLRRLPRPGAWMEHFRQAMGFPLLATVAWLVWVFGQQTGNDAVLQLLVALLVGTMGAWVAGRFGGASRNMGARALAVLLVALAAWMVVDAASMRAPTAAVAASDGAVTWRAWDPDAIAALRADGHVVFVDFTADWCLSCKANEAVALRGDGFAAQLRGANAVAMKADWTSADPRITAALAAFGRSGVPLYVAYPSDVTRDPIVLPQLLTRAIVAEALAQAGR